MALELTHEDPKVTHDALHKLIVRSDIETLHRVLENKFYHVARGDFHWLKDMVDSGMNGREIAELLVDVETQTPWNYYEPEAKSSPPFSPFFHRSSCVHSAYSRRKVSFKLKEFSTPAEQRDTIKRQIIEQLGFAGVVPTSRDKSKW